MSQGFKRCALSNSFKRLRSHFKVYLRLQKHRQDVVCFMRGDLGVEPPPPGFPDVSLLTPQERADVLSVWPSTDQIAFLESEGPERWLILAGGVLAFLLVSKFPLAGIAGISAAVCKDQVQAMIWNARWLTKAQQYVGIWHVRLLEIDEDVAWKCAAPAALIRVVIGEEGPAGHCSEVEVPWSDRCKELREGDECEVLVLSKTPYFDSFQVVRDLYFPESGAWLCDYPYVKRDAFELLSRSIYNARREGAEEEPASTW